MAVFYAGTNFSYFENTLYILEYVLYHSLMWNRSLYDTIYSSMDSLKVSIHRLHCAVYDVQCTVYSMLWKVFSVKCVLCSIDFIVCSVHCAVYTVRHAKCCDFYGILGGALPLISPFCCLFSV